MAAQNSDSPLNQSYRRRENIIYHNGLLWILDNAEDLKLCLLLIAHEGTSGHRGADSTWHALKEKVLWSQQRSDVRAFLSSFLQCILRNSGDRIPCPLSTNYNATKPNKKLHLNYLYLVESSNGNQLKYVLVLKDALSSYCWLETSWAAHAEHVTEVLNR